MEQRKGRKGKRRGVILKRESEWRWKSEKDLESHLIMCTSGLKIIFCLSYKYNTCKVYKFICIIYTYLYTINIYVL